MENTMVDFIVYPLAGKLEKVKIHTMNHFPKFLLQYYKIIKLLRSNTISTQKLFDYETVVLRFIIPGPQTNLIHKY